MDSMHPSKAIAIRRLTTLGEMSLLEQLQRDVWSYHDIDVTPARQFYIDANIGGLVLGAYDGATLVGFSSASVGREQGEHFFFSKLLAVAPSHRSQGIGYSLKMQQASIARQDGICRIRWTFDPLQPRNGYLNFGQLHAISDHFVPNMYGKLLGSQNGALESDRLIVDWYLDATPNATPPVSTLPIVNDVRNSVCTSVNVARNDPYLAMEIPLDFSFIRSKNVANALAWQGALRKVFAAYLPRYAIVDAQKNNSSLFYIFKNKYRSV